MVDTPRRYLIQNDGSYFYTGFSSKGMQVMMGVLMPNVVGLVFDKRGLLADVQLRSVPNVPRRPGSPLRTSEIEASAEPIIRAWQREIGFTPGTIHVEKFDVTSQKIPASIEDRPGVFNDYLTDPATLPTDPSDRQAFLDVVANWDKGGQFVLLWGNDFHMASDGVIIST